MVKLIKPKDSVGPKFYHKEFGKAALDFLVSKFDSDGGGVYWVENPVGIREFVESAEYLGMFPLSDRQYAFMEFMIGPNPKMMFHNRNTGAVLAYGKGAGKDLVSAIFFLYCIYVLLCCESPHRLLRFVEGERIDLLNVAPTGDKASDIFFEKVVQRILRWQWLKDRYYIKKSGEYKNQGDIRFSESEVIITQDSVLFPKLIKLTARNSSNESVEGYNTLVFVMDEASAFVDKKNSGNAKKIYSNLVSSCKTRFATKYKGIIISYPREENDFTVEMYKENLKKLHIFTDTGATWEVKPRDLFSKEEFEFEDIKIPMDFKDDFDKDPTGAKMRYLAIPPKAAQGFIEYPDKIWACVSNRKSLIDYETYHDGEKVKNKILGMHGAVISNEYVITVDLGEAQDRAIVGLYHLDRAPGGVKKYVIIQDAILAWTPMKSRKIVVSLHDVSQAINQMCRKFNVKGIWFDQWQSSLMIELLNEAGNTSNKYDLVEKDYMNLKEFMYEGRVSLLDVPVQTNEIVSLVKSGSRVDHTRSGSKDYCDTITGAIKILMAGITTTGSSEMPEVEYITSNLHGPLDW